MPDKYADFIAAVQEEPKPDQPVPVPTPKESLGLVPQPRPEPLPAPPPQRPESLGEILSTVFQAPGRAYATAGAITGGLLTGDIFQNPEAYGPPPTKELSIPTISPETVTGALKEAVPALKVVDAARKLFPKSTVVKTAAGLIEGVGETGAGLTSAESLGQVLTAPLLPEGKAAQIALAGVFETQAVAQLPEQYKAFQAEKDPEKKAKLGAQMAVGLGLPAAAGIHAAVAKAPAVSPSLRETLGPVLGEQAAITDFTPEQIAKATVPEIKGGETDAVTERPIEQGGVPQREQAVEGWVSAEAGGGDRTPEGGQSAEAVASSPHDYIPAIKLDNGEVVEGIKGGIHNDIHAANKDRPELNLGLIEIGEVPKPERGFKNVRTGEFESREQVSEKLGEKEPMQSERLRDLQKAAPEPKPSEIAATKSPGEITHEEAAQPEATREGVAPPKHIAVGSTDPREALAASPQALGITHPLPGFLKSIVNYFTQNTPSQIWNSIKGSIDATLGKTFSKTTIADRIAGELGARWISARTAAPYAAQTFTTNVLEGTNIDPLKFGAALTEDNLRSIRKAAETPEEAGAVTTLIGAEGSPFKTEAEYQAFLNDPATQSALERHRSLWNEVVDPMFRKAQGLEPDEPLPSRGDQTEARINLFNQPEEATGENIVRGPGTGNLTATMRRKSPFAIRAKGTGQSYNINYHDIIENTFGRQMEIAAKNDFERQLVEGGNAVIGKPGQQVTLPDGEETVAFPLKRTTLIDTETGGKVPVNQNIYVRKSLAGEYRRGADVDLIKVPGAIRAFNNVVNRAALAGLTDASVHVLNMATTLLTRPSVVGNALTDSLLSTFGRADVPFTIAKFVSKAVKNNQAQLAELAEIGALKPEVKSKNPLARLIQSMDRTTRVMLDDTYKSMVESGLVEDTETNRREFINQVGQYNKRAQGDLRRLARDSGFGPFATAGTTFNTLGVRTITGSAGIPAKSTMAAAALRANVLSKWVGGFVLTGTLNYLLTNNKGGGVMGRPGVPVGKIDTGLNDENGRPLSIPLFDILGLGRAMRVTGARGFIESQRKGLTLQNSFDAAATDMWNTNISPFTGPAIRFAGVASSGKPLPAINVPRTSAVVPPGESQSAENLKQAILDANPIVKSIELSNKPGEGVRSAIRQQIPRLSLQPSQSAEFMARYPEIVRKAQAREYVNDVIGRARKMSPQDQEKFVKDALTKLTPEDQKQAIRTLQYSHIHTGLPTKQRRQFSIVK